jgi:undecaprenyl-diphosphatase
MVGIVEQVILGVVQGIAEWLPVSSEGMIFLIKNNFFPGTSLDNVVKQALFLHLGTFFAALVYLRKDVWRLTKSLFKYPHAKPGDKKVINFLVIATLISGILGLILIKYLVPAIEMFTTRMINAGIGVLLLLTAFLQIKSRGGRKANPNINHTDSASLGIAQGLSVLPGLSRSGLTVSTLLLRKFDKTAALRLSFLLSLPIVLIGNIVLNFRDFALISGMIYGMLLSFVFGLLTIHALIKISEKVNFGYFVGGFGILMIVAGLI